jgi:hypothetical protein
LDIIINSAINLLSGKILRSEEEGFEYQISERVKPIAWQNVFQDILPQLM